MKSLEAYRKAMERLALAGLGVRPEPRHWASEVGAVGQEAALMRLPPDLSEWALQQNSSGTLFFMVDYSKIDGDDLIQ